MGLEGVRGASRGRPRHRDGARGGALALALASALLAWGSPRPAMAGKVGVGGFAKAGLGHTRATVADVDATGRDARVGMGFALDTAPVGPRLVAYRLGVGMGLWASSVRADIVEDRLGMLGLSDLEHELGFRLWRNDGLRVWAGPRLSIAAHDGAFRLNDDVGVAVVEVAVGPSVGVNVRVSDGVALCATAGWAHGGLMGAVRSAEGADTDALRGSADTGYVQVSVLGGLRER